MHVPLIVALALFLAPGARAQDLSPVDEAITPPAAATPSLKSLLGDGVYPASLSNGQCYEWKWRKDGANTVVTACEFAIDPAELDLLPLFTRTEIRQRPTAIVAPTLVERRYVAIPDRWGKFKPRKVYFQSPPEAWKTGDILLYTDAEGSRYVAMRARLLPE